MRFLSCAQIIIGLMPCVVTERDARLRDGDLMESALHNVRNTGDRKMGNSFVTHRDGPRKKGNSFDTRAVQMKSALRDIQHLGHRKTGKSFESHKAGRRKMGNSFDTGAAQKKSDLQDAQNTGPRKMRDSFDTRAVQMKSARLDAQPRNIDHRKMGEKWPPHSKAALAENIETVLNGVLQTTSCSEAAKEIWAALLGTDEPRQEEIASDKETLVDSAEDVKEGIFIGWNRVEQGFEPWEQLFGDVGKFQEYLRYNPAFFNDDTPLTISATNNQFTCEEYASSLEELEDDKVNENEDSPLACDGIGSWESLKEETKGEIRVTWQKLEGEIEHWFVVVNVQYQEPMSLLIQAVGVASHLCSVDDWLQPENSGQCSEGHWPEMLLPEVSIFNQFVPFKNLWDVLLGSQRVPGVASEGGRRGEVKIVLKEEKDWGEFWGQ